MEAKLGVAGVSTRPLMDLALVGVAGHWSPALRAEVLPERKVVLNRQCPGDRAAARGWERGSLFLSWLYMVVPDGSQTVRWRPAYANGWGPRERRIPLYLDSNAYGRWTGTAPRWDTLTRYCQAIDHIRSDGYMSWDVIGDNRASLQNYESMVGMGYQPIPVWQFRESWDPRASETIPDRSGWLGDEARTAVANGRLAARDSVMRYYCSRSRLVAIGGMARGPCSRKVRHLFIRELCRAYPDHQFWALAQASATVVNGLGQYGLLRRVWTDGTWWLHHARTEQMAIVKDGLLHNLRLTGRAQGFFTTGEMGAASIRALLAAYREDWTFPEPAPVPTDVRDLDALAELKRRLRPEQTTLLGLLPPSDTGDVMGDDQVAAGVSGLRIRGTCLRPGVDLVPARVGPTRSRRGADCDH